MWLVGFAVVGLKVGFDDVGFAVVGFVVGFLVVGFTVVGFVDGFAVVGFRVGDGVGGTPAQSKNEKQIKNKEKNIHNTFPLFLGCSDFSLQQVYQPH